MARPLLGAEKLPVGPAGGALGGNADVCEEKPLPSAQRTH